MSFEGTAYNSYSVSESNSVFHSLRVCVRVNDIFASIQKRHATHVGALEPRGSPLKHRSVTLCVLPSELWRQKFQLRSCGLRANLSRTLHPQKPLGRLLSKVSVCSFFASLSFLPSLRPAATASANLSVTVPSLSH